MSLFKPNTLTLALCAAGLAMPLSAYSAENDTQANQTAIEQEEVMETISITGFRRSLIDSINTKRFSDTVSEQISADDLGALPDVSISDALTRLPGISAVRTNGQSGEINIRGLAGGFVFTTLNGREQVSTKGERNIEFDQYPSELISSGAVYKSPKASLIEGGVAGTVELTTASPLSIRDDYKLSANARMMKNDRSSEVYGSEDTGHRLSVSYQGKFLDETLGVGFGIARLYQPSVSTQFIGLAYNKRKELDYDEAEMEQDEALGLENPGQEYLSEGMELQHRGGVETRTGFMGVLEYAPVDNFVLKADYFKSKFDSEEFARGLRIKFEPANAGINNPILEDSDYMIGGTISRYADGYTRVETANDNNNKVNNIESFGINANWFITDRLEFTFDVSHSEADSDFRNGLLWALIAEDANAETPVVDTNLSINYQLNGLDLPDLGINQADKLTDINHLMVSKYGIYPYIYSDQVDAVKFDVKYSLDNDFISSIEFGARQSEREYTAKRQVFEYGSDGQFLTEQAPLKLTEDMVHQVDWEGEFSYFPSYLAIDMDKALNAWFPDGIPQPVQTWGGATGVVNSEDATTTTDYAWSMVQSGSVYEDVLAAYVMANIDTELFGIPVTGNLGVRMVETEQSATELKNVDGDVTAGAQNITDEVGLVNNLYSQEIRGIKYTDYLPQMNLNFKVTENDQIRFAAAKVMSRPPIHRLAAQSSYNINTLTGEITGSATNNPALKPFYATQYDLSFERYFDDASGSLAVALFYKDIESTGITSITLENFDFAGYGFPVPASIKQESGAMLETYNGNFEIAYNDENGGYLRGIELSFTKIFTELPELFSGLGVNLNYSYTESEITQMQDVGGDTFNTSLPGLSKNLFTGTAFWEYKDFETRISVRYRDKFVSDQTAIDTQIVNYDAETVLDYQASYKITEELSVLFQANNLTDAPTKSYFGTEAKTGTIQYFGRQFYLGVNYSM
ncbi:TonB-dependent receptor [Catenovulum sp. 2E275]|uniref:TonB-dependent receptor n=1 Tax=Catenovulum sp. 2E275 TaxID=2980497 RepID=UPI0021D1438D|nr:TonB-dependent receptor [Catenovulum sp. 2E275]MCU4676096.1 TonB-dependent receptor [Catenovulum sp. 2E275]